MKLFKYILIVVIVSSLSLISVSCVGSPQGIYNAFTSFIGCVFYGDCEYIFFGSTESISFIAEDNNDGITLEGTWKASKDESYHTLTFSGNGSLSIIQYENSDNSVIRYDRGKYSLENDKMTIEMNNGTYSTVKYSIVNKTLVLNSFEEETFKINTAE